MQILLGVGGSSISYQALDTTVERARGADDDLTVAVFGNEEVDATKERIEQRAQELLEAADFEASIRRIDGDPGSQLVQLAADEQFDRVVLGSGKRNPLGKIQLGSVAEFVLLNAQTPVTLVR